MNQNAEQFLSTEDFVLYVEEDADQAAAESIADELQINRIQKSSAGSLPARCLLMDAEGLHIPYSEGEQHYSFQTAVQTH